jgi:hypothetical protein
MEKLVLVLPIIVGLLLKIAGITVIPKVMMKALEEVVSLPGSRERGGFLDLDQRSLIVNVVSNAALKITTVLTFITSGFNFAAVLYIHPSAKHLFYLAGLTVVFILALFWLIPLSPQELSERTSLGMERATVITLMFCILDICLALLTIAN